MPRTPVIAGNWKMHKTLAEAADLANALALSVGTAAGVDVVLCPPFTTLATVAAAIKGTNIKLGAQNCHFEDQGAFTGEISPAMLKDLGVSYCILGHSERRQFFGETDAGVNRKARALYKHGIIPIICVGETLEDREAGQTAAVVTAQIRGSLEGLPADKMATATVIAYEPVWAIGTGKTATKEQAQEVHALIRNLLASMYTRDLAMQVPIQYGGSVKPANARELMEQTDIDGALVGGAALDAESFTGIVKFD